MKTVYDFTVKDRKGGDVALSAYVGWNFTKFLVSREGRVVARFEPTADMAEVRAAIAEELKK
jgi:glutathione peroxidase